MNNYIKNGFKVLVDYLIALLIFVIFIYVFISLAGNQFITYLPLYSILVFTFGVLIVYSDMKGVALKEKKPQYELKPYPLKGAVYGLLGFVPIAVLEIISVMLVFSNEGYERIKHVSLNVLMGPVYFMIRLAGEAPWGYALASLLIPLIAMIGYISGFYGFEFNKKKKEQYAAQAAAFKKSPWNPSNNIKGKPGGKKKTKSSTDKQ